MRMYAQDTDQGLFFPAGALVLITDDYGLGPQTSEWEGIGLARPFYSTVSEGVDPDGNSVYEVELRSEIYDDMPDNLLPRKVYFTLIDQNDLALYEEEAAAPTATTALPAQATYELPGLPRISFWQALVILAVVLGFINLMKR